MTPFNQSDLKREAKGEGAARRAEIAKETRERNRIAANAQKSRVDVVKRELKVKVAKLEELKKELESIERARAEGEEEVGELLQKIKTRRKDIPATKSEILEARGEIKKLKDKESQFQTKLRELKSAVTNFRGRTKVATAQLTDKKNAIVLDKKNMIKLESEIASLSRDLNTKRDNLERIQEEEKRLEIEVERIEKETGLGATKTTKPIDTSKVVDGLESELRELIRKREELQRKLRELETNTRETGTEIGRSSSELNSEKSKLATSTRKKTQKETSARRAADEVDKLEKKLAEEEKKLKELEK